MGRIGEITAYSMFILFVLLAKIVQEVWAGRGKQFLSNLLGCNTIGVIFEEMLLFVYCKIFL